MNRSSYMVPVLYLKVDESGTPGKCQRGKTHYIMAGCLVGDETGFDNATARRYKGRELKFHDDRNLRKTIIKKPSRMSSRSTMSILLNLPGGIGMIRGTRRNVRMT